MIALLGVWLAAIASPGPDLVQIIRVGSKDRRSGVMCALGIMLGNTIWLSLIHISEPTRPVCSSRMPSSA